MKATVTAAAADMIDVGGDLTAARLGYGAMRITGPGVWGEPPDRDRARAALRRAVDLGVTFIDTADAYGPEVSERLIARDAVPVSGGTGHRDQGWPGPAGPGRRVPDGRPKHLRHACGGSLARPRLDRIDLYQLHRNFSEDQLREAERVTPVVSVQNVAAAGLELSPDEVTAVTSRPDAGILGLPETTWSPSRRSPGMRSSTGASSTIGGQPS